MITQTHKLDVVPGGVTAVVHVKQYQTGESLVFELFSRFGEFEISSTFTDCTVRGTKSDGNGYSANATCDPSNNSVTVELTEQMTAVAGRQPYEITITESTGRMITTTFILDVHRAALDADTVVSESVIREVQTIVEEYIEDHPGLFVVDPTLTQSGEAADAKVTGDEIADLKSAINSLTLGVDETDELIYIYVNGVKQGEGMEMGGGGTRYTVTYSLINASSSSTARSVPEGRTYTTTLSANTGYVMKEVSVSMGGTVLPNAYNSNTGVVTVENVSGNIVISAVTEIEPIDLLNVTWANHAITCGQSTNNYNAWAPHNLQYDSVRDEFVFLQCHCNRHLNQTYTNWTLSVINPYDSTDVENITIPEYAGLGMLFVEDGTWTLMPRNGTALYRSTDRGVTWDTVTASIPQYLFGVYKCGNKYFAGNDSNNEITYYESSDLINWTTKSFDSSLGYSILCETSFAEYGGKYWAFNRTNDATLGHPVILMSEDEGETWTLFSDQLLHGYRSTVSCYPFKNFLMIADIARDDGMLYYSKFDGTTVTELNSWQVPYAADDFHNVNIVSNYKDTVILNFMHATPGTIYGTYYGQRQCDNVMLVGSTKQLPSVNFTYLDTKQDVVDYLNEHSTTGLNGENTAYAWQIRSNGAVCAPLAEAVTTFVDEIPVGLDLMFMPLTGSQVPSYWLKDDDAFVKPMNNALLTPSDGTKLISGASANGFQKIGYVIIKGIRYAYGFGGHANELPVLTKANYLCELQEWDITGTALSTVGQTWQQNLGLRKVISVQDNSNKYGQEAWINFATSLVWSGNTYDNEHVFGIISYTPLDSN